MSHVYAIFGSFPRTLPPLGVYREGNDLLAKFGYRFSTPYSDFHLGFGSRFNILFYKKMNGNTLAA